MRPKLAAREVGVTKGGVRILDGSTSPSVALDTLTRRSSQGWLLGVRDELAAAIVLVTHDVDDVMTNEYLPEDEYGG